MCSRVYPSGTSNAYRETGVRWLLVRLHDGQGSFDAPLLPLPSLSSGYLSTLVPLRLLPPEQGRVFGSVRARAERPDGGGGGLVGSLWSVAPLESSLVRSCKLRMLPPPRDLHEVCYMEAPSVATRSDGGLVADFIYAIPRHRRTPPPPESRKGYSSALSPKAARTIQAASELAYRRGAPFRAMWVFSVTDEHLPDFLPADGYDGAGKPRKTLSGELRRFFNAFRKYCRDHGLGYFDYAWAAESESSGARVYHPHAHCLITLTVARSAFADLCETVERVWGLGSVNITFLRVPRNAARYVLKGVRYSVKGTDGTQGRVWGYRSGVSSQLRHKEQRIPHSRSVDAAMGLVEVANALRERGLPVMRTAYGVFTPRGFCPNPGVTYAQVSLAARIAMGLMPPLSDEVVF